MVVQEIFEIKPCREGYCVVKKVQHYILWVKVEHLRGKLEEESHAHKEIDA